MGGRGGEGRLPNANVCSAELFPKRYWRRTDPRRRGQRETTPNTNEIQTQSVNQSINVLFYLRSHRGDIRQQNIF